MTEAYERPAMAQLGNDDSGQSVAVPAVSVEPDEPQFVEKDFAPSIQAPSASSAATLSAPISHAGVMPVSGAPFSSTVSVAEGSHSDRRRAIWGRIGMGLFGAGMLVVGALVPLGVGLISVTLIGVVLLLGWSPLLRLSHPTVARIVMEIVLLAALAVANWGEPRHMAIVAGLSVGLVFVAEMTRKDGRDDLIEQASGTFAACFLVIAGTMWTFAWRSDVGRAEVFLFAAVIATVAIVESLEARTSHVLAFIDGVVVGIVVAWACDLPVWAGVAVGIMVAASYLLTGMAVRDVPRPSTPIAGAARAMTPIAILGMGAYMLSWILV